MVRGEDFVLGRKRGGRAEQRRESRLWYFLWVFMAVSQRLSLSLSLSFICLVLKVILFRDFDKEKEKKWEKINGVSSTVCAHNSFCYLP